MSHGLRRVLLPVGLLSLLTPAAAEAAFPGRPGEIVYGIDRYDASLVNRGKLSPGDLFTTTSSGGASSQVTNTVQDEEQPAFSPGGAQLAFQRFSDGDRANSGLVVSSADGSDQKLIVGGVDIGKPAWTPNGRTIVFDAPDGIYRVGVDGSGKKKLLGSKSNHVFAFPTVTPDGTKILYTDVLLRRGITRSSTIRSMPIAGGPSRALVGGKGDVKLVQQPDVMPSGERFAFVGFNGRTGKAAKSGIYTVKIGGGDRHLLKTASPGQYFNGPSVAADGGAIVVTQVRFDVADGSSLQILDLATRRLKTIKVLTQGVLFYPNWQSLPAPYAPAG